MKSKPCHELQRVTIKSPETEQAYVYKAAALGVMLSRLQSNRHLSPHEGTAAKAGKRPAVQSGSKAAPGFAKCTLSPLIFPRPSIPLAQIDEVRNQLDYLRKSRQVLSAQGVTVNQECQGVLAQVQGALRTLQSNAAANARKKITSIRTRGKLL